ncbi:GAF domain-containing SpoIIE family protein phosphatase [Candidatus Chrysopegis kryptomonas]|uniref:Serine phosphatase RsbU, regulator of sigma subunit n=1 Tax=Candidatus Chryseopegocella kryptomonas TaxID=1633643 RepID=A0A0P1MKJ1_9BACT|nr:PP2C family protein-serine/threonine phosphatase [Candidatus Chrysopegis kryptomonas]CUS95914.1 Serine phosphatase RsbU, regulator of sigma subunit [Candidatus Chrysopegis kryptomonas]
MNQKNYEIEKTFSFGQILLAFALAFVLLAITLVKKIFPFPAFDFASNIIFLALFITLVLIVQPFAKKFEKNPVEGIKFIIIFLIPLVGFSFAFKNFINLQKVNDVISPSSYADVILINIHSLIYTFLVSIVFSIFLKIFFFARGKEASVKFTVSIAFFVAGELIREILEELSLISQVILILQLILFVWISFRIPWVISLSKREKYKVLLYSFLVILFLFLLQSPFATGNSSEGMRYYSTLLFSFAHFYLHPFLIIYSFFVFSSTIFHLPTAEIYERKVAELSTLQNIGKLVAQVLDIKEFSDTAVKIAMEMTGSKSAWVELKLPYADEIYGVAGIDEINLKSLREEVNSLRKNFEERNLESRYIVSNIKDSNILIAPLVSHQKISGFLYLVKQNQNFTSDEIGLALALADQIAIGVENSRLIQESIEKERLSREFELAQQMQKKLLPKVLPSSEKFEISALSVPAFEVGGDYYDFFTHDDGNLSVIIADVSGKGISAAFYMAEMKGIFQSLAKIYPSPVEFLIKVNDTIFGHIDRKFFITLVYAYFDLKKATVELARAGHLPPVFVKDGKAKFLKSSGLGVGLVKSEEFGKFIKPVKLKLDEGDLLILYSDGVIEAMNELNEEFGYKRFEKLIEKICYKSSDEIVSEIFNEVESYQKGTKQIDDITILAVKWKK